MIRSKTATTILALGAGAAVLATAMGAFTARAESYRDRSVDMAVEGALDLERYAGTWYEIARFPNEFEENCAGVTAEYALMPEGGVGVTNTCRKGTLDGPVEQAEGEARVAAPGRLEVRFAPEWLSFLPMVWGDYWVLAVSENYTVAVVGSPDGETGWVLAREPQIPEAEYEAALGVLRQNGYDISAIERVPQFDSAL
ncbi:MAG TPA: lipocalin [Rhodobacteraceae bacterium]|nr:lipocalin [Paracoccaceae bacterium]